MKIDLNRAVEVLQACGYECDEIDELTDAIASRDAEIAELNAEIERKMSAAAFVLKERDQLREQVTLLRDALGELVALKNLKDRAESAEDSSTNAYCGNEYATRKPAAWKAAREALAATTDLDGLILCHATPDSYRYKHHDSFGVGFFWSHRPTHQGSPALESVPLFIAWEPKP